MKCETWCCWDKRVRTTVAGWYWRISARTVSRHERHSQHSLAISMIEKKSIEQWTQMKCHRRTTQSSRTFSSSISASKNQKQKRKAIQQKNSMIPSPYNKRKRWNQPREKEEKRKRGKEKIESKKGEITIEIRRWRWWLDGYGGHAPIVTNWVEWGGHRRKKGHHHPFIYRSRSINQRRESLSYYRLIWRYIGASFTRFSSASNSLRLFWIATNRMTIALVICVVVVVGYRTKDITSRRQRH